MRPTTIQDRIDDPGGEPFELVTYGRGGRFPSHKLDKISTLLELDDVEQFGRNER